jgi:hypothetical protein
MGFEMGFEPTTSGFERAGKPQHGLAGFVETVAANVHDDVV